jgi:hypothetical protein
VSDGQIALLQGERGRFIVLKVRGRKVVILIDAPPASWTRFLQEANRVLKSVRFRTG